MKYDNNKSLTENAMAGVDITEPDLPDSIVLDCELPDDLCEALGEFIMDYCAEEYHKFPVAYGWNITLDDITWEGE